MQRGGGGDDGNGGVAGDGGALERPLLYLHHILQDVLATPCSRLCAALTANQ